PPRPSWPTTRYGPTCSGVVGRDLAATRSWAATPDIRPQNRTTRSSVSTRSRRWRGSGAPALEPEAEVVGRLCPPVSELAGGGRLHHAPEPRQAHVHRRVDVHAALTVLEALEPHRPTDVRAIREDARDRPPR